MRRGMTAVSSVLLVLAASLPLARPASAAEVTPAQVRAAIDKGVKYLRSTNAVRC